MELLATLDHERADLEVSLWLQDIYHRLPNDQLPQQFMVAYRADQVLSSINQEGLAGYFQNESESVGADISVAREIGQFELAEIIERSCKLIGADSSNSDQILEAVDGVEEGSPVETELQELEEKVMDMSGAIEAATHAYIRKHIETFLELEKR